MAKIILDAWPTLSPRLRSQAAEALLARAGACPRCSTRSRRDSSKHRIWNRRAQQLLAQPDAAVRARATALVGTAKSGQRQEVVEAYRPVLSMSGDPAAGKRHFQKVCAACHRVEGVGYEIGANLGTMKNRGPEAILVNLLDPNREVNPQFVNYTLVTSDGRILTGMVDAETATSVTLKRGEKPRTPCCAEYRRTGGDRQIAHARRSGTTARPARGGGFDRVFDVIAVDWSASCRRRKAIRYVLRWLGEQAMQLTKMKLVTIIGEEILKNRLVKKVQELGATGASFDRTQGVGARRPAQRHVRRERADEGGVQPRWPRRSCSTWPKTISNTMRLLRGSMTSR